jgi:hypothetical protein
VRVHCFGCDFRGDALHLVAAVRGLDVRRHFADVVRATAEVAHRWDVVHELDSSARFSETARHNPRRPNPRREEPRPPTYPPEREVVALWRACRPCADDRDVSATLEHRALPVDIVDVLGLARALPMDAETPAWARFRGHRAGSVPWTQTGHRLVLPVYDRDGRMPSLRAWCVADGDDPKRLPPAGFCATGLVLACPGGAALLAGRRVPAEPARVVIVEGEPDFLTWATRFSDAADDPPAVFGVVAGSWSNDVAARIPEGSRVVVRTHHDLAGDGYAQKICVSLARRCTVLRSRGTDGSV